MRVRVRIEGYGSGMLMSPMKQETLLQIRAGTTPAKNTRWTVEEEAASKLSRDEDGILGIPADNLMACLILGSQKGKVKIGRTQLSTLESTQLWDMIEIEEDWLALIDPDTGEEAGWKPHLAPGKGERGKTVAIVRPRFPKWAIDLTVELDAEEIDEATTQQVFYFAGRKAGLGDWGPRKRGKYGRFRVTKWEKLDPESAGSGEEASPT